MPSVAGASHCPVCPSARLGRLGRTHGQDCDPTGTVPDEHTGFKCT